MAKPTTSISKQEIIDYKEEGQPTKRIGSSFFRGKNINLNPYLSDFGRSNFISKYLMQGWKPDERNINQSTQITAFGSCFADNVTAHLSKLGFSLSKERNPDIYISKMGEGLVNVHSLAQQFEWALEGIEPPQDLWQGYDAESFGYDPIVRERTREAMLGTDFFFITMGLSEIWYDEDTGGVFWRAVPKNKYDPARHKFRVCSLQETKQKISDIYSIIRKHIPHAKVLFTLSPVPLAATFRPISCVTANSSSKAILRASLDEFMRENAEDLNKRLFYFPSYEIITDLFFSRFVEDGRHPHKSVIELIMKVFEAFYCQTSTTIEDVEQTYQVLRRQNGEVAMRNAEGLP